MFYKDRGIDFSVWLCWAVGDTRVICAHSTFGDFHFTARHFLGFPLFRPMDGKKTLSDTSTAIENQIFTKIVYCVARAGSEPYQSRASCPHFAQD